MDLLELWDISQGVFQLELPEGWMIYNILNKDLLIQCRELQFKGQYRNLVPLPDVINKKEEYDVKEIRNHRKQGCGI